MLTILALLVQGCSTTLCAPAEQCTVAGREKYDAGDPKGALDYWQVGCSLGDAASCYNGGVLHSSGELGKTDPTEATRWFRRGCAHHGTESCYNYAVALMDGLGTDPDVAKATELFESLCTKDSHGAACNNGGLLHLRKRVASPDVEQGASMLARSCELAADPKHAVNCSIAARLYAGIDEGLTEAQQDAERSGKLLQMGCEHEDGDSCMVLGMQALQANDPIEAAKMSDRGCALGSGQACLNLGVLLRDGKVTHPTQTADSMFARACELGVKAACP